MQIRQDNNIIVTSDEIRHGLAKRTIYGLNVFNRNHVAVPTLQDPRFLFLKSVTDAIRCSAHVGAMALSDRVDTPEELFGHPKDDMAYSRTTVEYHDGFFDLSGSHYFGACFFPFVSAGFWEAHLDNDGGDMEYIIRCHGMALYVGASRQALDAMTGLFDAPFPGETQWLRETTRIYPLVLVVGHDGDCFHAYAKQTARFQLLDRPLLKTAEYVRSSNWFQHNQTSLSWNDENMCLTPGLIM